MNTWEVHWNLNLKWWKWWIRKPANHLNEETSTGDMICPMIKFHGLGCGHPSSEWDSYGFLWIPMDSYGCGDTKIRFQGMPLTKYGCIAVFQFLTMAQHDTTALKRKLLGDPISTRYAASTWQPNWILRRNVDQALHHSKEFQCNLPTQPSSSLVMRAP